MDARARSRFRSAAPAAACSRSPARGRRQAPRPGRAGGPRKPCIRRSGSAISSAAAPVHAVASGFAALDAELPDGGWPRRVLSELLLPHPGVGEIRLLAPPLVAAQRAGRPVMIFDPPADLSAAALAGLGFDVEQLLVVNTRARVVPGSDSLWALEQALKSGHVGAVLAWLPPRLRTERLRRLQLAAHQPRRRRLRAARAGGGGAADRLAPALVAAGRRRRPAAPPHPEAARPAAGSAACSSPCRRCSRRRRGAGRRARCSQPVRGLHEAVFVNLA